MLRILLLERGLYIVHETGRRQWSGVPSDIVCHRRRLPPLRVVASCGGRGSQEVSRVFLEREDVFYLCDKAALLLCSDIRVYSGDFSNYESYSSLECLLCIVGVCRDRLGGCASSP